MTRKHIVVSFVVTLLFSVCAVFALTACGKSPWCGTYYLNNNAIVIDENTITSGGNSQGYTISGNVMRLDNGAEFRFANDYRVLYSPTFLFMRHGNRTGTNMFTTRSGPWDGSLVPDPLAKNIEIYDFYPDGTYKYISPQTVTVREGNYTLNSGVLVLFQFADDGSDGIFYIDESYDIYFYAYVKDITEFTFFPDENDSEDPPSDNEHVHSFTIWEHDGTAHWKECSCGATSDYALHTFTDGVCACGYEHDHTFGEWQHDNTAHWKECSCGKVNEYATHTFSGEMCTCGYKREKFTVTLKWNIPDMPDTVTEIYAGDPYTLPAPSERLGYTFEGWSTTVSGQSPAGEILTIDGDITCYAQWHLNEYRITFVTEHDETPSPLTFTVNSIQNVSLPVLKDDNLTFRYWALDEEGKERVDSVTELKDYTLYAVWVEIPPYHTGDRAHLGLAIGETCPTCGLRVEYTTSDAVLMVNDEKEYGCGEYYGETAGDQLDRYAHKVNYIYLAQTVQQIGDRAFSDFQNLKTVSIEEESQLISIGFEAFYDCSSLSGIDIPSGVTSIENYAFNYCSNLQTVTFSADSRLSSIGYSAFAYCRSLTSVNIPSGVTSIDGAAFQCCSALMSIEIPSGVTEIEGEAFTRCSNLRTVTFAADSRLSSIGYNAFSHCSSLTSIEIPSGVTEIGQYAFEDCDKLQTVFYGGDAAGWNDIQIGSGNQALLEADLYFYSAAAPEKDGNFWHYGADGKTPKIWVDKKTL